MTSELKRRSDNKTRVLELLQAKGRYGATNVELVQIGGLRAGARIFELRKLGWAIKTEHVSEGLFRFTLLGRNNSQQTIDFDSCVR